MIPEGEDFVASKRPIGDPRLKEHDRVRLIKAVDDEGETFPVGTTGVIVSVYRGGEAFAVEVLEDRRESAIVTVPVSKLEAAR